MTNITKINDKILKIAHSLGQTVELLTDVGDSTADLEVAKYEYFKPLNIFISLPIGEKIDDIYIYLGKKRNDEKCQKFIDRVKMIAHFNGIGVTVRNHTADIVKPKHFADEARATKERTAREAAN